MQPAGDLAAPLGGIGQVRDTGQQSGRVGLAVCPDQAGDGDSQAFHAGVKDEPAGLGALVPVPGLVSQQAGEHVSRRIHATGPAARTGVIQHSQQRRRVHDQHDRVRVVQHQPGLRARDPEPVRERGHRVIEQPLLPACQRPQGERFGVLQHLAQPVVSPVQELPPPLPGTAGQQQDPQVRAILRRCRLREQASQARPGLGIVDNQHRGLASIPHHADRRPLLPGLHPHRPPPIRSKVCGKLQGQAGLPRAALPGHQPHPQVPPGHAPRPQLAQFRPRPERHHLGLRAQVPGSTVPARGTGDCAARSRRCHGGRERLQRSLAPFCHAGIPLPPVTRQLPHHRGHEPRQRRQHPRPAPPRALRPQTPAPPRPRR